MPHFTYMEIFQLTKTRFFLKSFKSNVFDNQPKIKVVSPNFNLKYNLDRDQIKDRLEKKINSLQ